MLGTSSNENNLREHAVLKMYVVSITTNHKSDGVYLPADDRRHFVAWSGTYKAGLASFSRLSSADDGNSVVRTPGAKGGAS